MTPTVARNVLSIARISFKLMWLKLFAVSESKHNIVATYIVQTAYHYGAN